MTMLTMTRRGQPGAVHVAGPVRPELTADDWAELGTAVVVAGRRLEAFDKDDPMPGNTPAELLEAVTLAADDLLTAAAWLAVDPAPFLDVRELVGLLPGGADHPAGWPAGEA